jgi:hypothetical protein
VCVPGFAADAMLRSGNFAVDALFAAGQRQ